MAYTKTTWTDESPVSSPIKYEIIDDVNGSIATSATIAPVTSITPGIPLNATNLNHMETGIENAQIAADAAQVDADAAQVDANKGVFMYERRDVPVWVPINGATALANTDKGGFPIPARLNGATLIGVPGGRCRVGSSSGNVVLTLTNTNGNLNMLGTNITVEAGETSSLTATTPATVSANNVVATDDWIEVGVSSAGVGVTFCGVMLIFRPAGSA